MATNGRCIAFLEAAVATGEAGKNIAVRITDVSVILSMQVEFVMQCYAPFASGPVKDIRSICHKFPMEFDDPMIRGFRHKRRGNAHHIAILFAPEVQNSQRLQELKNCIHMEHILWNLRQFFTAFQPISDRSQLQGKCRRRSDYDRARLMIASHFFGHTWGFPSAALIERYRGMKGDKLRASRTIHGKSSSSKSSSEPAAPPELPAEELRPHEVPASDEESRQPRHVPQFGLKIPLWRGTETSPAIELRASNKAFLPTPEDSFCGSVASEAPSSVLLPLPSSEPGPSFDQSIDSADPFAGVSEPNFGRAQEGFLPPPPITQPTVETPVVEFETMFPSFSHPILRY